MIVLINGRYETLAPCGAWSGNPPFRMAKPQLEELFRCCDQKGTGLIDVEEFRDLCAEFGIDKSDSDVIFADLDHDGDGKVSLEDFAWGFRQFMSPDERRNSIQIIERAYPLGTFGGRGEQRRLGGDPGEARAAWSNLVAGVGEGTIHKFLNRSGKKLADLYEELQTANACPELLNQFEGALSSLIEDVKKLHDEKRELEDMFTKEKENHLQRLRGLEEELDAQVAKIEENAREEARIQFENEKRVLMDKMESESSELQAHLKLLQKMNDVLSTKRGDSEQINNSKKPSLVENRELRMMLNDTKANLAVLRSEMSQLKVEYEKKCRELLSQQESAQQFKNETDYFQKQLQLLHDTNQKLQDTNDSLLFVVDDPRKVHASRPASPFCSSRAPSQASSDSAVSAQEAARLKRQAENLERLEDQTYYNYDQEQNGAHFVIQRLMDDIDSGRSTLRDNTDDSDQKSFPEEPNSLTEIDFPSKNEQQYLDDYHNNLFLGPFRRGSQADTMHRLSIATTLSHRPSIATTMSSFEQLGEPDRTFKVVFAGDAAVGKSCFIHRFSKGVFTTRLSSTLGVDFKVKSIKVGDKNVALQLWDTAGQERFRSMTKNYFRRADGVVLLYDVTNERSFINVRLWIQSVREVAGQIPVYLCGNKIDLREKAAIRGTTCVPTEQGQKLADECEAVFMETSSKSGLHIHEVLEGISRDMLTREDMEIVTSALQVMVQENRSQLCCR
nr:PREDICTED: ras and EF-hand domain-containing protein homolog isoform X1 [Bemisia tabaci]